MVGATAGGGCGGRPWGPWCRWGSGRPWWGQQRVAVVGAVRGGRGAAGEAAGATLPDLRYSH